jgi:hypothetical protein
MQAKNFADEQQNSTRRETKLDDRYGKIGIQAVAAAVRCRGQERKSDRKRYATQDSD